MQRLGLALVLAVGCSSTNDGDGDAGDSQTTKRATAADGADGDDDPDATAEGPKDPESVPITIDDGNRFVKEDLDRFLDQYPDALRDSDAELFRTCVGAQCLEHGAGKSLTPFVGAGVRYLVPLWLRGCLGGSAEACMYAGRTYQGSQYADPAGRDAVHEGWTKGDLQARFRMYIDRACKLEEGHCEQWADFLLGDEAPDAKDVELAIRRLKDGCGRKAHGSCEALARHAGDHPGVGDEVDWWRQACDHDPDPTGGACAQYADRLLATGNRKDRAKAIEALGPTCDPQSESWTRECKGDAEAGEEACEPTYLLTSGHACVRLAQTMPDAEALRLFAAMCVGSLLDETNAIGRKACDEAARLAKKLRKPKAYRSAIARRTCAVDEMTCLSEVVDLDACAEARRTCEAAAGG